MNDSRDSGAKDMPHQNAGVQDSVKGSSPSGLAMSIKFVKGVGEARARQLARLGIDTVKDLMEFFPVNYISRKMNAILSDVSLGEKISLTAMISWVDVRAAKNGMNILTLGVTDGTSPLICTWFRYPPQFEKQFLPGHYIWLSGTLNDYNGQMQLNHPDFELLENPGDEEHDWWKTRSTLPVYRLTASLTQKYLRRIVYQVFSQFAYMITENLPVELLEKHRFLDRKTALQKMHFGSDPAEIDEIRRRFAYEELFYSQIMWARHRYHHNAEPQGITFADKAELKTQLFHKLPFRLTNAQIKVIREIFDDMRSPKQMSRLLQGDVGSGKTIVTLFAMLLAVDNGYQAALMAPTEILADQHYANISRLLEGLPVSILLLKGGNYKGKAQQKLEIASGEAQIVIGTHALLQSDVSFARLGFVAVDEQHRFGVEQRAMLARKDKHPDLLYLSATPIPRSLSMTVYGDLELSILDELPPTRKPIQTFVRSNNKIDLVYKETRKELLKGRQVYIVCPLIEESEKIEMLDAERLFEHIKTKVFPECSSAILHGKMPAREKEEIMLRFKSGETKILVSTTVIEVGVDVPNASVMIVEHAERFGLAQLHQLRGRVGRGAEQAYCYLIQHLPCTAVARERLTTMNATTDGFVIAEKDLELRGPGEMFGREQSGLPRFRFANILRDQDILKLARADAFEVISLDPDLAKEQNALLRENYSLAYTQREKLILY